MKAIKIEIKWALIFVVMMLAWMLMEKLMGYHDEKIAQHAVITNLVAIPAILIYILALRDKRKVDYNGSMTYLQGFVSGLIITAFVTLLSPLTQYITSAYITPDYFQNVIAYSVAEGYYSQIDAEAFFNMENYMIMTVVMTPIMGVVTSAIAALFFIGKK